MSGTIRERRQRLSWLSVAAAWVLFAIGVAIVAGNARAWAAWGTCYVLALVLWFPVPRLIWKRVRS
jgi:hypothetical protein